MSELSAAELQDRYSNSGDVADLHAAIDLDRSDLARCEPGSPSPLVHLSRLCNALRMRYDHLGRDQDLDDAVTAGRDCVDGTPDGHRSAARRLSNLGFALRLRYELRGQPSDIEEAVRFGRQAVEATSEDDPALPRLWSNLAVALRVQFEVSADRSDLAAAIDYGTRGLIGAEADAYERRGMLSNLGLAHFETFEVSGNGTDLAKGAALLHQAIEITPEDDPDWAAYAVNLSVALRTVAVQLNNSAAADDAVRLAEHARDRLRPEHREWAGTLSELGRALRVRARIHGDAAEGRRATGLRRSAAGDPRVSPTARVLAARAWGDWAREDGDTADSLAGFAAAIDMLPVVAWRGLGTGARQRHLRRFRGLAQETAAACTEAGAAPRAVELLEQGRTVLWNQLLDQRTDLALLRTRDAILAERLDRVRDALDSMDDIPSRGSVR